MNFNDERFIGKKVWSLQYGWGKINKLREKDSYPILVSFDENFETYAEDGKMYIGDVLPSIFWNEFKVPDEAYVRPIENMMPEGIKEGDILQIHYSPTNDIRVCIVSKLYDDSSYFQVCSVMGKPKEDRPLPSDNTFYIDIDCFNSENVKSVKILGNIFEK